MAIFERKLSEEDLKEVNGGYLFLQGNDRNKPFEVIDDNNGAVLAKFSTYDDAKADAIKRGMDWTIIYWDELNRLREN